MAISIEEILMGRVKFDDLDAATKKNILLLHERINKLRTAYGKPMKVNDGYRRPQDTPSNGAAKSKHLMGLAIDLDDNDVADLWKWVQANLALMKSIGLWMEDPRWTHGSIGTWVHFQVVPPQSGKRIFVPSTAPASAPALWDGIYDSKFD